MKDWKQRYETAYRKYQEVTYPTATKDFGHLDTKWPAINKHNGLRQMIVNFLRWSGHHAEPTQNMGRPVKKFKPKFNILTGQTEMLDNGIDWQKGSGIPGSSDVKGHINVSWQPYPVPVYIEAKVGKDIQRPNQEKYEKMVTSTGALYWLIYTPEEFLEKYDNLLNNIR